MSEGTETRVREGHELLRARIDSIPDALRRCGAAQPPWLPTRVRGARACVVTGVGSSVGHAHFLAHTLTNEIGLPARYEPVGQLAQAPPPGSENDLLVVFSQGLSPNVRFAFEHLEAFRACLLVGAELSGDSPRAAAQSALRSRGVVLWPLPVESEYGLLVRVVGPALGYLAALQLASELGGSAAGAAHGPTGRNDVSPPLSAIETVAARMELIARFARTHENARTRPAEGCARRYERAPVLLAADGYGGLLENLRLKFVEGLWLDPPAIWELLEFAHGGVQQLHARGPSELWWLGQTPAPADAQRAAVAHCLDPELHELLYIPSELAGNLAIFEHEAWGNEFLLSGARERALDLGSWPGHGFDAPLYRLEPEPREGTRRSQKDAPEGVRLSDALWPRLAEHQRAHDKEGGVLAILPLGSTEQHGAHLPFATDTLIADALAERLRVRLRHAWVLPAIPFGCASEHLDFPGTLHVAEATLFGILDDLLTSLARHHVAEVFIFSAHGGNASPLRALRTRLAARAERLGLRLLLSCGLDDAMARVGEAAEAAGISHEAAGHHAGESETSMMLALSPSRVRPSEFAEGHMTREADPQALFYPSLRDRVPSGVVGDPRSASALRGQRYLDLWSEYLRDLYLGWTRGTDGVERKKRTQTKGIQRP